MFRYRLIIAGFFMACLLAFSGHSQSVEADQALDSVIEEKIKPIIRLPQLINAVKVQNQRNEALKQQDILALEDRYASERGKEEKPLIEELLARGLSKELRRIKRENEGLFTEIIIIDNRGVNVAQSDETSDLWQGDEAKWQRTFLLGPHAVHVSDMSYDESTGKQQVQVSATISENGLPLGVATFGIDLSNL